MVQHGSAETESSLDASILLVASHHVERSALRAMIGERSGLRVAGEVETEDDAVSLARRLHPDAVLIDVDSDEYDTVALVRRIRDLSPEGKILAFGREPDQRIERALAVLGVEGFILWDDLTPEILYYALGAALTGVLCVGSRAAVEELIATPERRRNRRTNEITFTDREREILSLLADDLTEQEVAARTGIGLRSTQRTARRLQDKLFVSSLRELRKKARELGFGS